MARRRRPRGPLWFHGKHVYISGPVTDEEAYAAEAFAEAERILQGLGAKTYNPYRSLSMYTRRTHAQYMRHCLHVLSGGDIGRRSNDFDAIVMLSGWEYSIGASFEEAAAREIGVEVVYFEELRAQLQAVRTLGAM